jgi:hypothetical protein
MTKPLDRNRGIASRRPVERRVELGVQIESPSDATKTNDLGANRKSGQELRAL